MQVAETDAGAAGTWTLGDRQVHRMGFGSMRVTARADRDAAIGVIRQTVELGVNHIDTAAFYFSPAASSAPARDLGVMPPS